VEYLEDKFQSFILPTTLGLLTRQLRLIDPPSVPHIRLYCNEMYGFMVSAELDVMC
jgi:hypothetical protein